MIVSEPSPDDFVKMASLYNKAISPFYKIYSPEEKLYVYEGVPEDYIEMRETRKLLCIKHGLDVLGYAAFRTKNTIATWINEFYIDPDCQRKGVGSRLLQEVEIFAKNRNCIVVALETHSKADWAIDFYQKNGYGIINDKMDKYPYNAILDKPPVLNRPLLAKLI